MIFHFGIYIKVISIYKYITNSLSYNPIISLRNPLSNKTAN